MAAGRSGMGGAFVVVSAMAVGITATGRLTVTCAAFVLLVIADPLACCCHGLGGATAAIVNRFAIQPRDSFFQGGSCLVDKAEN